MACRAIRITLLLILPLSSCAFAQEDSSDAAAPDGQTIQASIERIEAELNDAVERVRNLEGKLQELHAQLAETRAEEQPVEVRRRTVGSREEIIHVYDGTFTHCGFRFNAEKAVVTKDGFSIVLSVANETETDIAHWRLWKRAYNEFTGESFSYPATEWPIFDDVGNHFDCIGFVPPTADAETEPDEQVGALERIARTRERFERVLAEKLELRPGTKEAIELQFSGRPLDTSGFLYLTVHPSMLEGVNRRRDEDRYRTVIVRVPISREDAAMP